MLSKTSGRSQATDFSPDWQCPNGWLSTEDCIPKIHVILDEGYGVHKDGTKCKRHA